MIVKNKITIKLETRRYHADYITRATMIGNIGEKEIKSEIGYLEFTNSYIIKLSTYGYKMISNFREASISDKLDLTLIVITQKMIEIAADIKAFSNALLSNEVLEEFDYEYEVL